MTFGVVMAFALSSLGCQNQDSAEAVMSTPQGQAASAQTTGEGHAPGMVLPPGHHCHLPGHQHPAPGVVAGHMPGYDYEIDEEGFGTKIHKTVYSFIFGHDPDVPTVAEIEGGLQSGAYEQATAGGYQR